MSGIHCDVDAAIKHLAAADPMLTRLIAAIGPFRMELLDTTSVFAALAQAIVYQQLNAKAAATILGRVRALFPDAAAELAPEHILGASEDALRSAGLSRNKRLALRDLAQRTAGGELPTLAEADGLDDETLVNRLTRVRGIGRWTVEMFLMFRLGRPDVLPLDDYGLRRGYAAAMGAPDLPSRGQLAELSLRWKPYRTVASWYLWRAAEQLPGR